VVLLACCDCKELLKDAVYFVLGEREVEFRVLVGELEALEVVSECRI